MPLTPGIRLGTYEVLAERGKGGMGEVYRARDTKLGRDVALKVLPELFSSDSDRLARFTREAQVLASLNHPNIAASRRLTFVNDSLRSLWRVALTPGATMGDGTPQQMASLPPDGIFMAMMPHESRFLMLSPERTGAGSITVVQNWRAARRR